MTTALEEVLLEHHGWIDVRDNIPIDTGKYECITKTRRGLVVQILSKYNVTMHTDKVLYWRRYKDE